MKNKLKPIDLNLESPDNDGNFPTVINRNNSTLSTDGKMAVYFRDLTPTLLACIKESDAVFGCVAWLTNHMILDELSHKQVSIVVQKEDFLRPDYGAKSNWKIKLREKYSNISCSITRHAFPNMIKSLSVAGDPTLDSIRCVGNHNKDKLPAFPRMHNKFLVFAKLINDSNGEACIKPYAIWTGSFNFTANAEKSLENALYITDAKIVDAYFNEFGQIMAISEPLDWESQWIAPEFRIGT